MKQFADSAAWRKKLDITNLFAAFDTAELEDARRFYPRWTGRRDLVRCVDVKGCSNKL
jgi:hypothetical protein